jgi:hypothetical protein
LAEESDRELTLQSRIIELESILLDLIKSADDYSMDDPPGTKLLAELQETIRRAALIVFKEIDEGSQAARH